MGTIEGMTAGLTNMRRLRREDIDSLPPARASLLVEAVLSEKKQEEGQGKTAEENHGIRWAATSENWSSGFPTRSHTNLRHLRKWLKAWNFVFRKERDNTIHVAKTKALISFAVAAKLICVFVLAYAKIRFSHIAAQIIHVIKKLLFGYA